MKENFKKILKNKKLNEKIPKYNKRKLSIGLVSCLLAFGTFFVPVTRNVAAFTQQDSVNDEVVIKDEMLKRAIISQLKYQKLYTDGQKITKELMGKLSGLDLHQNFTQSRQNGVKSLEGLEYAVNMTQLDLAGNEIVDLTPIKNCKKLEKLDLSSQYSTSQYKELSDISPLANLTNLKVLKLKTNDIQDVSVLKNLINLEELDLFGNRKIKSIEGFEKLTKLKILLLNRTRSIKDITALKECKNLQQLSIQGNKVDNIDALKDHKNLEKLDISSNNIKDITAISSSVNLTELLASGNKIENILAIKDLVNLKALHISENKISDISSLEKLTNLTDLDLSNNPISSIDVLKNLTKLTELKLVRANNVKDFSAISYLKNLEDLDIISSGVKDISFLNGLDKIDEMSLQYNDITDPKPLENLKSIRELKLGGNKIKDASFVKNLRSRFNVAIEMGGQEIEIGSSKSLVKNPIVDQKGNKLDIKENSKAKNNKENIEILNFDKLNYGDTVKVRFGVDAEFNGNLIIKKVKKDNERYPVVMPDKTHIVDIEDLQQTEKNEIEWKIKEKNPNVKSFSYLKDAIELIYEDESKNTIKLKDITTKSSKKFNEAFHAVKPKKILVGDDENLTETEKEEIISKVKEKNPRAKKVEIVNDTVILTYKDNTQNKINLKDITQIKEVQNIPNIPNIPEDEKEDIKFIFGKNQKFDIAKNKPLYFEISSKVEDFKEVYMDNKLVDKSMYDVTKGSTIVTFKDEFKDLLSNGKHTFLFKFNKGSVETQIVVLNSNDKQSKPDDSKDKENGKDDDDNQNDSSSENRKRKSKSKKMPKTSISQSATLATVVLSLATCVVSKKRK